MHRERDSRGRFIATGRSLIPTTPLTPPRPRSITPPSQTHIPYCIGHRLPEVLRSYIQLGGSPTSSTETILEEEDPRIPTERVTFFTSTGEHILTEELEIPSEEEEEDPFINIPLIDEIEEQLTLQVEPYIGYEESIMAGRGEEGGEGEGEIFNG